jgi:hypothetical protein
MAEIKTKATKESVTKFLSSVKPEEKKKDALTLLKLFKKVTGEKPVMWGESIVGFGKYHYKSERSSQQGDWPLVAFSPRKQSFTLYIMYREKARYKDLLQKLGKHTTSIACVYVKKLSDIDLKILSRLIKECFIFNKKLFADPKN